ncbi:unnamed protein product [Prorocentrum cordatum]|uniref:Uncharacterized protein n=1 Tax=Prorocentrum cordatum TaxID=2364126 RepID=A0ABN9R9J3_9DINO|nr:unnamed protein product [Polarella glacialis]
MQVQRFRKPRCRRARWAGCRRGRRADLLWRLWRPRGYGAVWVPSVARACCPLAVPARAPSGSRCPRSQRTTSPRRTSGLLSAPPGATCRIERRGGDCEDVCGRQLDRTLRHPQLCKQGPARMRPHRALAATLARLLRECRAEVDIERTVAELERVTPAGRVEEAILDSVVSLPGSVQPLYVDVTIRCPRAARYLRAATVAGDAADEAARGKRQRYGSAVLPVAVESYGRLGAEAVRSLEHLATYAGACIADDCAAPRLVPRWRAALERITQ